MKSAIKFLVAVILALVLGVGSALWVIYYPPVKPAVRNGAWYTNLKVGSADADMYLRAYIARIGLFALNKKETIYYHAETDDEGEPLRSGCDYLIEGRNIPARWWAITLYGEDHFLIPNEERRHSYNMRNVEREPDGTFRVHMSSGPKDRNWLPAGGGDQRLSLSLRVYNPEPIVYEEPDRIILPRITKEGCR